MMRIETAIARSIARTEIIAIETDDVVGTVARVLDIHPNATTHDENGGAVAVVGEDWRLLVKPSLGAIVDVHMGGWADGRPVAGFVSYAWAARDATLAQLVDGEIEQLACGVRYSVEQDERYRELERGALEDAAAEWLRDNRAALVDALRASLEDA